MNYKNIIPTLFKYDDYQWSNYLAEHGYVVIKDILKFNERDIFWKLFKNDLMEVSPNFRFEEKNTWTEESYPGIFDKGIIPFNGLGQSNFSWFLRTNSKIQSLYQHLFNIDDLVVSMDAFSLFFCKSQQSEIWNHLDQNPKNEYLCYQGAYNYFEVDEDDSGFIVAPTSHLLFKPEVKHKKNWINIPSDSEWNKKMIKLLIPENCFVIWNSRTIHANVGMTKADEINRLTVYITYMPRNYSTKENTEKRVEAYLNGETCTHWANKCVIKKIPWDLKTDHENKKFNKLEPLIKNNNIPINRKKML